ncbi:rubredoxin [Mesorhizobium sp. ANAO-SY3R2]|uniref:rubredoxin n=1 Tax=Mesorhizobium sp. ANAO-SY3R2 TaxID=3166644 RepID=UPI00366CC39C
MALSVEASLVAFKVWECVLCGFRYDEAAGDPDGGVAPGTRWEDVPEDWVCPECGARKSEFDMTVVG